MLLFPATSTTYNVPFLEKFQPPATLHFMQENDPKYTLHTVQIFIQSDVSINWWHSSTVLPDVNSIKNLWHEMKTSICQEVKPTNKAELIKRSFLLMRLINVVGIFAAQSLLIKVEMLLVTSYVYCFEMLWSCI